MRLMRNAFFCLLLLSFPSAAWPQGYLGFTLPGGDYDSFDAHSPQVCHNTCGGELRCTGWTWAKAGGQAANARCWLKASATSKLTSDTCCTSGKRDDMIAAHVVAEDKTDRPGLDYRAYVENSWEGCEVTCRREEPCSSWTYRRRTTGLPTGACWLKTGVARPVANGAFVSGVKFKPHNL